MKKPTLVLAISLFATLICNLSFAQQQTLQEKLGYDKEAILLIIHADDVGVGHAVNQATLEAFEKNSITSCSIMVPTPWFTEWAEMIKDREDIDAGIHITLTAEWDFYRWDGVSSTNDISTLINDEGYFYDNSQDVAEFGDIKEVEKEVRAQIDRAKEYGISITHLDSHMGTMFQNPAFLALYVKLGREYNIPVVVRRVAMENNELNDLIKPEDVVVEKIFGIGSNVPYTSWTQSYIDMLDQMVPGLNEIVVHLGYDNAELQAMMINHPDFGAKWRQNDLNAMNNPGFKKALKDKNIHLVNWGTIKNLIYK